MLHTIGKRERPDGDLVDALTACHDRIRERLAVAARLASAENAPAEERALAAEHVRKYFTSSFLEHVRDEEELVVPQLRGWDPATDAALERLADEHADHELPLSRLVAACNAIAMRPEDDARARAELKDALAELAPKLEAHLAHEENAVFPALRTHLDPVHLAALRAELRARRGL